MSGPPAAALRAAALVVLVVSVVRGCIETERVMSRLMEMVQRVIAEQDRCAVWERGCSTAQSAGSEGLASTAPVGGYDRNDGDDRSVLAGQTVLSPEEGAYLPPPAHLAQATIPPGHVWRWWSSVLGEEVVLVRDDAPPVEEAAAAGRVVYRVSEVTSLSGVTPDCLRVIHQIKRTFGNDALLLSDALMLNDPHQLQLPDLYDNPTCDPWPG